MIWTNSSNFTSTNGAWLCHFFKKMMTEIEKKDYRDKNVEF